ncbi:hypothetical protein PMIN03_012368 [Paraphaeosphaeria minitans]
MAAASPSWWPAAGGWRLASTAEHRTEQDRAEQKRSLRACANDNGIPNLAQSHPLGPLRDAAPSHLVCHDTWNSLRRRSIASRVPRRMELAESLLMRLSSAYRQSPAAFRRD